MGLRKLNVKYHTSNFSLLVALILVIFWNFKKYFSSNDFYKIAHFK